MSRPEALGLTPESVYQVLAATPLAKQAERCRPSIEADEYPARFALVLACKDAEVAGRTAQDYKAVLSHIQQHTKKEPWR